MCFSFVPYIVPLSLASIVLVCSYTPTTVIVTLFTSLYKYIMTCHIDKSIKCQLFRTYFYPDILFNHKYAMHLHSLIFVGDAYSMLPIPILLSLIFAMLYASLHKYSQFLCACQEILFYLIQVFPQKVLADKQQNPFMEIKGFNTSE